MNKLGAAASSAELSLHATTACETADKFNGISKEYWFKHFLILNVKLKQDFVAFQIAENLTEEIESLICKLSIEKKKLVLKRIYLLQDPNLFEKKSYEG